jgi:hypothetical protein
MDAAIRWSVWSDLLLLVFCVPASHALSYDTEQAIRGATFEFVAPGPSMDSKSLVGTAFAIGPNQFVTAAHLLDEVVGSHFKHPVLTDSNQIEYQIADILQFSEEEDYAVFSLTRPPRVNPLAVHLNDQSRADLYFAGWRPGKSIGIEHVVFAGLSRDETTRQFEWLRFSGDVWGSAGGGPVLDSSGHVIGIVEARARNGGANYAVPIDLLPFGTPEAAHIHATQMLRDLMPTVSSLEPLQADIPLPTSFEAFSRELEQLRAEYFDRVIGPLLEATRRNFVLTGDGAADVCNLVNGKSCQCKAREGISGRLVVDDTHADELNRKVDAGGQVIEKVAGIVVVRIRDGQEAAASTIDVSRDPILHFKVAREGQTIPDMKIPPADQDGTYNDFHDRNWHVRTWPVLSQDLEVLSLVRKLPDGYVVLTRTVKSALTNAALMQLKFVANVIFYECEDLQGEDFARMANAR